MTAEEREALRRKAVASKAWRRRKEEVQRRLQEMDLERAALLGLLRSIESEEAKARSSNGR